MHQEKVGRNDPCPCGSGKKFKKCCEATMHRLHATPLHSGEAPAADKASRLTTGLFSTFRRAPPHPSPEAPESKEVDL